MRPIITILLSLGTVLNAADDVAPPIKKLPAVSVLPDGSELKGVMIPRHDENHRLVGSLKAELITLVSEEIISGEQVDIDFFREDGSQKGHIHLNRAIVKQAIGMLESTHPVAIDTDTFNARGKGLHYAFQNGQGFLVGPATSWIRARKETAMNAKATSVLGATGLALISQTVAVTAEPATDKSDPVLIQTVDRQNPAKAQQQTRQQLDEAKQASDAASKKAQQFIENSSLDSKSLTNQVPEGAKPLEVTVGAKDTVISCDGGMYFDADKGLLVYLKNVRVNDPRYLLTGADELKVFLTSKKKPVKPGDKTPPASEQGSGVGRFDEVDRIVATGAVRILQRDVEAGKAPVEASGAFFSYKPSTGEILLSGGYPWVKQGNSFMRAKEPNLNLRIQRNGSFVTEGHWEMGGQLNQK